MNERNLTGKKPIIMTNRLAFAHMLPEGGTLKFRALRGQAEVKRYLEDKAPSLFLAVDPALAQACGATSLQEFGDFFASMLKSMVGIVPEGMEIPPVFVKGATILYAEFDILVSEIQIPGQPQARVVAHWFEVTVEEGPEAPVAAAAQAEKAAS